MRKSFALGLLALTFGFFASSATAGNVEVCEVLKDGHTKGLYGLCIAYANAGNENARERIYDNYEARMGDGDPTLDELFEEKVVVECPCWTADSLATATAGRTGAFCTTDESGFAYDEVVYSGNVPFVIAGYSIYPVDPLGGTVCILVQSTGFIGLTTSAAEDLVCRTDVRTLQSMMVDEVAVFPPCL